MTTADRFAEPMLAEWSNDYCIGVDDIDNQHRQLFVLVNDLWQAVHDSARQRSLGRVFRRLEEYTVKHFRDEEMPMSVSAYPGYEAHQRAHAQFVTFVDETKARYRAGGGIAPETLVFFNNWLIRHIQKDDRAAADYYLGRLPPRSLLDKIFGRPGSAD